MNTEGMTKAQASMKIREVIAKQKKQQRQISKSAYYGKTIVLFERKGNKSTGHDET